MDLGNCPHRLRVNYVDKHRLFASHDEEIVRKLFRGAVDAVALDGCLYIGFRTYKDILQAFDMCAHFEAVNRRMVDPYALHISLSRFHTLWDIETYFQKYGTIFCVTEHHSSKGRYAFINFSDRRAPLRALCDGSIHMIKGSRVKIRSKVLSAAEPHVPKPWSPARFVM